MAITNPMTPNLASPAGGPTQNAAMPTMTPWNRVMTGIAAAGAPKPTGSPFSRFNQQTAPTPASAPRTPYTGATGPGPQVASENPGQMPGPSVGAGENSNQYPGTTPAAPAPVATPSAVAPGAPGAAAPGGPAGAYAPTGAETGALPTSPLTAYGPDSTLIGSQINASGGPSRSDIANQYFQEMQQASNPAYEASLRDATQRAAATGSLGSGMLNTSYGNLALQRAQNLDNLQRQLQTQATEGTIGDQRFATGVAQQQQGYQAQQAQQALQNRMNQLGLEQQIGQNQSGYLAGYNPWPGITGSNVYGQQAAGANSQLQQLMQAAGIGQQIAGIGGNIIDGIDYSGLPTEGTINGILGGSDYLNSLG